VAQRGWLWPGVRLRWLLGWLSPLTGSRLCVPKTSSASCDQVIFADQAASASLSSDAVLVEADWFR
jgi:hypothetical protein